MSARDARGIKRKLTDSDMKERWARIESLMKLLNQEFCAIAEEIE